MSRRSTKLLKAALSALHYTGADNLIAPFTGGSGVIFMLHHVSPDAPKSFEPNRILKITPAFLEAVIAQVQSAGFDIVSLDEAAVRMQSDASGRPFACFTFDDGYRDNRDHAYPIFKKHGLPFTIYVPSDFPDGRADLWWLTLEEVIARAPEVAVQMNGDLKRFATLTPGQKDDAFHQIYWWLRWIPENRARGVVAELAASIGFDDTAMCRELLMTWDEIRALAADPLVTFGAHTCSHLALAKLSEAEARHEMAESKRRLEVELGRPCLHFSYPYGDHGSAGRRDFGIAKDLGFVTAVTTRKGLLHAAHKDEMTALPRFSLNGDFQDQRYLKVMLSGAPFALWNAAQRMSATRSLA